MNNEITPARLFNYLSGRCTAEEKAETEAWISASDANRELYEEHRQLYEITGAMAEIRRVPVISSLQELKGSIPRPFLRRPFIRTLNRAAAILFWPLLAAAGLLLLKHGRPAVMAQMRTPPGVVTKLVLPDSTVVWLNGGTTLKYPQDLGGRERQVWLDGEAYFEVAASAAKPFTVNTGAGVRVNVLGTRFNVNAYTEDSIADVSLVSGAVKVEMMDEQKDRAVTLQPGQKASRQAAGWAITTAHTDQDLGWVQGKLVLRDMPMDLVMKKLSRRYNVDIVLADERLKDYNYTATITGEPITQVLEMFRLTSPLQYEIKENGAPGRKTVILSMLKKK